MPFHHQGVCSYCWHTCSSPSCLSAYLSITKGLVCIPVRHQGACLHTCPSPRGLFAYLSISKGRVCIPVHHQGACLYVCPPPKCVFVLFLHVACLPVITKVLVYTGLYQSIILCLSVRQVLYAAVQLSRYHSTTSVLVCNAL